MLCTKVNWCDFFVCTSKDSFVERIYYDEEFMTRCIVKASICFERIIFPEFCYKEIFNDLEAERCVKVLMKELLDLCEEGIDEIDFNVDFCN